MIIRFVFACLLMLLTCAANVHAQVVNGCDPELAQDMTGQATVIVAFGGIFGLNYSPRCMRVDVGVEVSFNGAFSSHPLQGGTVSGGVGTPDNSGPIQPTNTGSNASVVFPNAGTFPYYCGFHGPGFNMAGVVFVGALPPPDKIFGNGFEEVASL